MIAVLLVISFILHALSLFVIILLYLQLSKVKETETSATNGRGNGTNIFYLLIRVEGRK